MPTTDWEGIARESGNRPWPTPHRPWVFAQTWENLLFAHWRVPHDLLRGMTPAALTLETFAGEAWVGVVPFHLRYLGPGRLKRPFGLNFLELNVRTYVTADGKPGVWFFSLDAASLAAVIGARIGFHLPYFWADISMKSRAEQVEFSSRRHHPGSSPVAFHARYGPAGDIVRAAPGSLEEWLTERYCFYSQDRAGRIYRGEIAHARWPLQPAEASLDVAALARSHGFVFDGAPLLHFSRRLDMVTWGPTRVG